MRIRWVYPTYLIILSVSYAAMMCKSLIYAHYLSYEDYAALSKSFLASTYLLMFCGLGMQLYLLKKLPIFYVNNQHDEAKGALALTFLVYLAILVLFFFGVFVAWVLLFRAQQNLIFCVVPIYTLSQVIFSLVTINIRSQAKYVPFSVFYFARAILVIIAAVCYGKFLSLTFVALLLESTCNVLVCAKPLLSAFSKVQLLGLLAKLDWKKLREGLVLLAVNGISLLFLSLDKIVGIFFLSNREFAPYAFAVIVFSIFESMQFFINTSIYTELGRLVGQGNYKKAFKVSKVVFVVILAIMMVGYFPGYWLLHWLIVHFMPKYQSSLALVKYIMISGFFLLANFFSSYAILMDKEWLLCRCLAIALVIAVFVVLVVKLFDPGVINVMFLARLSVCMGALMMFISYLVANYAFRQRCLHA